MFLQFFCSAAYPCDGVSRECRPALLSIHDFASFSQATRRLTDCPPQVIYSINKCHAAGNRLGMSGVRKGDASHPECRFDCSRTIAGPDAVAVLLLRMRNVSINGGNPSCISVSKPLSEDRGYSPCVAYRLH